MAACNSSFAAALSHPEIESSEAIRQSWERIRRASLEVLTLDSQDLVQTLQSDDGSHTMLNLAESLDAYLNWLEQDTGLLKSAYARLWTVLIQEGKRASAFSVV
jgi:hypothetical protein